MIEKVNTRAVKISKETANVAAEVKKDFVIYSSNRQYSYSPTVLGRVGLDHECEAHAGTFSPRGQRNMRKLRQSLPNLRKIFNIVKFRRAYILERSLFQTTKGRCAHYY